MVAVQELVYDHMTGKALWMGLSTHPDAASAKPHLAAKRGTKEIVRLVSIGEDAPFCCSEPIDCNKDGRAILGA